MHTDKIPSGYKLTEVGIISSDWDVYSIDELVNQNIIEKPLDGNHGELHPTSKDYVSSGIPFIMANNINNGILDIHKCYFITKEKADSLQKGFSISGDVLLTHKGTVGNTTIVENISTDYIMLTPQVTYYRVKDKNKIINTYIKFYFESDIFRKILERSSGGGTRAYIGITSQRQLPFILPPIEEQKRIAQVLSDIDELIRSLDELIIKKRNIKQGTMQLLLTGKQRLPGYSGEWEVKKLGDIAEISRGASPRPIDSPIWFDNNSKVGWVRISDVTESNGKILLKTKDYLSQQGVSQSRFIAKGNLIMSICATVGLPVITGLDVCIHDGFVSFFRISKNVDVNFLYYKLKEFEKDFKSMGQTGSQSNLNSDIVRECSINIPTLEEQKAIARILSDMDEEIEVLEAKRDKYQDIKKGMMQELLTGKTRI